MCALYPLLCLSGNPFALVVFKIPAPAFFVFALVVVGLGLCNGVGGVVWWGLDPPWRAYLNRFSPAPSSHRGCCTLIRWAGTLDPGMHRCVACTKVMAILCYQFRETFTKYIPNRARTVHDNHKHVQGCNTNTVTSFP